MDDEIGRLIEALKDARWYVRKNAGWELGDVGDASAIPVLIKALGDENGDVRRHVAWGLGIIVIKCESIEALEEVEKGIVEGSKVLRKGPVNKTIQIEAQLKVVNLLKQIAERKNELAPKRDLLLPDTIKPPKKGGIFRTIGRMRTFSR